MSVLVKAEGIQLTYEGGRIRALAGVDLHIREGETLALVGESGSGKSTLGRVLLRMLLPTQGRVVFRGTDLAMLSGNGLREMRRHFQMVFQNAAGAFNPRMRVGVAIGEPLLVQGLARGQELQRRVAEVLQWVGIPISAAGRLPHEFSGGQLQRIGIARALIGRPAFMVADESLSALDPTTQEQILAVLRELKSRFALTYLFISHDLRVVQRTADRVAVMYLGKIVELAATAELFARPGHPYTQALLDAIPVPDVAFERSRVYVPLAGELPSPAAPPTGCHFHPRCPRSAGRCRTESPVLNELEPGHQVACHFPLSDARSEP